MAKHQFGIMEKTPAHGERYDHYTPEKYTLIAIDDDFLEPLLTELDSLDFFWHALDVPGKGLAYCGITLIPPESMQAMLTMMEKTPELEPLKELLRQANEQNKYVIHYGL